MPSENDTELIQALKLAVEWKDFKIFCAGRSTCKGCPYCENHICSMTSTDKILTKIAKAAREYLIKEGIPI